MSDILTEGLDRCPTPWCGPKHEKYTWQGPDDLYCVICDGCQVVGPSEETESEAIAAWNARSSLAAQDGLVEALERCAQIVEQWNHRQNEKVDDIKYIVRNALSAIKGDKS